MARALQEGGGPYLTGLSVTLVRVQQECAQLAPVALFCKQAVEGIPSPVCKAYSGLFVSKLHCINGGVNNARFEAGVLAALMKCLADQPRYEQQCVCAG